jgi:ABC-type lipoprotein release transport system permease subunit
MLFGTAPLEPAAYTVAVALLMITALCATAIPARRAATIDPVKALRQT